MNRDDATREIKSRYRDYLSPAKKKNTYICPLCGNGTGETGDGICIDPNGNGAQLKCFACGFYGDIIDLYSNEHGCTFNEAFSALCGYFGVSVDSYKKRADFCPVEDKQETTAKPLDLTEYYKECQRRLSDPDAVSYLQGRGISPNTAAAFGLGYDPESDPAESGYKTPRIIIPTNQSHYIGRSITPNTPPKYAKLNNKGGKPSMFNVNALYEEKASCVFIVEGVFDALSIIEVGGSAVAINSTSNVNALLDCLTRNRTNATLILCLDNDGKQGTATALKKMQEGLEAIGVPYITSNVSGESKDPNEALTSDRKGFASLCSLSVQAAIKHRESLPKPQPPGVAAIDKFITDVQTRKYEPIPTGISDLDKAIGGGFIRQQLVLLGAAPGAGKTALAQWVFENMAERGHDCIYLNLEMSREQVLARSFSRLTARKGNKLPTTLILQGYKWSEAERKIVIEAAEEYKKTIASHMLYNPDSVSANLDSILNYIEGAAEAAERDGKPAPNVVIDYLQIITGEPREDAGSTIKRAVAAFKDYAIKHNAIVFVIIAHNRAANSSGNVTMEAGRDTSALEYSADLQLALTFTACLKRDGKAGKSKDELEPEEKRNITLKVTKGRFGGADAEIDLYFDGASMTYTQMSKDFTPVHGGYIPFSSTDSLSQDKRY